MKKSSSFSQNMGSFHSPSATNSRNKNGFGNNQKGWCSEHVPNPKSNGSSSSMRRHKTLAGLTAFNSGKTMPSKWNEAERWVCSPFSVSSYDDNNRRISYGKFHHRPKSISGPIMPPKVAPYYSNCYSPNSVVPLRQGLVVRKLMVGSPFSTGVLAPVVSVHHYDIDDNGIQCSSPVQNQNGVGLVAQSSISNGDTCSELKCDSLCSNLQDEKHDGLKNEDKVISIFSRCDKGTQMSSPETENDIHSSPKSSATSVMYQQDFHSPKLGVRDVQIDSQAILIKWSKKHATKLSEKDSIHSKDSREDSIESKASSWDVVKSPLDTSKLQREEAKIIAWENLQKAKAEAAIRKLEMKLEKKKSSSMDKILNKLRRAKIKAENMRSSIPTHQGNQVSKTCKVFSFPKHLQMWSPSNCFGSDAQ
ncbi:hypothetical protein TanjilG_21231 [Lupinus angustifolius]|uniref:Remorin C-terminal domain-containing protein n=1 Tax=Lupinus angustifolius TaxID=3871 RepID=A0A1J7I4L7_LUPAN|nr:PREDICTED: uncharacterized protein LOC109350099 isoform X1 [Lupinus angustifolius]OIW09705.1 hypothetical protein TanjilG_21231 [Lupinus angustifolius]